MAARTLAQTERTVDPDQAYVLGLLHDLSLWSEHLTQWRGHGEALSASEWIASWNLPLAIAAVNDPSGEATQLGNLIARAEELAELAGFRHPQPSGEQAPPREGRIATMEQLVAGNRLRNQLTELLAGLGLDPTVLPPPELETTTVNDRPLFTNKMRGSLTELILSLGSCHASPDSRGVVTATNSAALRFLGFDRAYVVRWMREHRRCWVRVKADFSPLRFATTMVDLTQRELQVFRSVFVENEPRVLDADSDFPRGLLGVLGSERALLVPINPEFSLPTLLLLDRSVSIGQIDMRQEREAAKVLSTTSTLLLENLLLKRQRSRAMKFALTDPLTRLANRGVGINTLRQEIARANRTGEPLTVLMLDLDRFKALNDKYGHLTGDLALRNTADVLRKTMRRMDTVCRYGGEEFMVILPNTDLEDSTVSATRIYTAVQKEGGRLDLPITVSIGIASFHQGEDTVETLLARADRALYASKERGRNRFSVDAND
jgi:diguanylate cyclase (GGDEF)-like protein